MSLEARPILPPTVSPGAVPRGLWIGAAVLGLATAGIAGALAMRAVATGPADPPTAPGAASVQVQAAPDAALPAQSPQARSVATPPASRARTAPTRAAPVVAAVPADSRHAEAAAPGAAAAPVEASTPVAQTRAIPCASCGVVESVSAVQQPGQATGVGAVAGGVLGGVVGHQIGGGNGKTAMTVLGAIGGVMAGNEVEKRSRSQTLYNVQVRLEDGSTRVFQQAQSIAVGTRVVVEGSKLRIARSGAAGDPEHAAPAVAQPGANA